MKRDWLTLAFGLVLVWVVVGLSLRQNLTRQEQLPRVVSLKAEAGSAADLESPPRPTAESAIPSARPADASIKTRSAAPERTTAPTAPPDSAAETPLAVLQVHSDVPGASVFLDREFVGATPLTLRALTPGLKQLNVTAAGHDGYSSTITLTEGPNRVNVEFMKIHLNAAVPVVHRHTMGSCQGTLAASPKGLSYEASNKSDAFALAFGDIDEFEMDYVKKNLRIRRRAGKTWNFTNDSADALFVFHRDVNKAREKLAATR
jgi:PEGA domain